MATLFNTIAPLTTTAVMEPEPSPTFQLNMPIAGLNGHIPQLDIISPYSRRVCGLVSQGFTSEEIAYKLDSNPAAVDVMVSRSMKKIGVRTRAGLTAWYLICTSFNSSTFNILP